MQQHHTGCKCRECFGFAEYMLAATGKDYGLPRAPGHDSVRLRVLTFDKDEPDGVVSEVRCSGRMTCECPSCAADRAERVQRGVQHPRQPWEVAA